jgi:ERCC4-type nuclease
VGKKKDKPLLTWVYDSREQRPYDLAAPDPRLFEDAGFYEDALEAGDITCEVDCVRVPVILERKQHTDFVNCCARERERFENELARLAAYQSAHVLIEAPVSLLRAGHPRSQVPGLAVWNSMACWSIRFPTVHFWTLTNRVESQIWARTLLLEAAKHHAFKP